MRLIFIYGPVASGKLTIARRVSDRTGFALFHNHLIVDAVAAVFPFGSEPFCRLRERFWLETFEAAAAVGQSLVFTFAPEPTVAADFPDRAARLIEAAGGRTDFVALTVRPEEQERRLVDPSRRAFGKLMSTGILRDLRVAMDECMQAMPTPALRLDTDAMTPEAAADAICRLLDDTDGQARAGPVVPE